MVTDPCQHCQYELTGIPVAADGRVCPECGGTTPHGYVPKSGVGARVWIVSIVCGAALCFGLMPLAGHLGGRGYSVLLPLGVALLGSSLSALLATRLLRPEHRSRRRAWWVAYAVGVPTAIAAGLVTLFFHFLGAAANC